jgi:hypothetical protein
MLGPPEYVSPEDGDRIHSPKRIFYSMSRTLIVVLEGSVARGINGCSFFCFLDAWFNPERLHPKGKRTLFN